MSVPPRSTNKDVSERVATKPMARRKLAIRVNQARSACRRPYRDLERRQTASGCVVLTKPIGC
jgi:hypothetical protein